MAFCCQDDAREAVSSSIKQHQGKRQQQKDPWGKGPGWRLDWAGKQTWHVEDSLETDLSPYLLLKINLKATEEKEKRRTKYFSEKKVKR